MKPSPSSIASGPRAASLPQLGLKPFAQKARWKADVFTHLAVLKAPL